MVDHNYVEPPGRAQLRGGLRGVGPQRREVRRRLVQRRPDDEETGTFIYAAWRRKP